MEHQDWKPVVWTKKIEKKNLPKTIEIKNEQKNKNTIKNTVKKVYTDNNEEEIMPAIIDHDLSKIIQQKRLLLKISQQELANKLSIPVSVINQYEKGEGIRNGTYINKIKKFLNISNI